MEMDAGQNQIPLRAYRAGWLAGGPFSGGLMDSLKVEFIHFSFEASSPSTKFHPTQLIYQPKFEEEEAKKIVRGEKLTLL